MLTADESRDSYSLDGIKTKLDISGASKNVQTSATVCFHEIHGAAA